MWERKWEARCLGYGVARSGPLRARRERAKGWARGRNFGWEAPREGCRAGMCGCAGRLRADSRCWARRVGRERGGSRHALILSEIERNRVADEIAARQLLYGVSRSLTALMNYCLIHTQNTRRCSCCSFVRRYSQRGACRALLDVSRVHNASESVAGSMTRRHYTIKI